MIRFINLSDQICENTHEFAFWNTGVDRFCTFNDTQTWESIERFIADMEYDWNDENPDKPIPNWEYSLLLERYLNLIPSDWDRKDKTTNRKLTHHPECCCQYNPSSAIAEQTVLASECCPIHNFYPAECFAEPKCKHCK